jgi:hypothetical protein
MKRFTHIATLRIHSRSGFLDVGRVRVKLNPCSYSDEIGRVFLLPEARAKRTHLHDEYLKYGPIHNDGMRAHLATFSELVDIVPLQDFAKFAVELITTERQNPAEELEHNRLTQCKCTSPTCCGMGQVARAS